MSVRLDSKNFFPEDEVKGREVCFKELQWSEDSSRVEVSVVRRHTGSLKAINDCSVDNFMPRQRCDVIRSLSGLHSVDIGTENCFDGEAGIRSKGDVTHKSLFLTIPDGPIGLDLKGRSNEKSCCGGLEVSGVFSSGEFEVSDLITSCNGVSLINMPIVEAIEVLKKSTARKIVVIRPLSLENKMNRDHGSSFHEKKLFRRPHVHHLHWKCSDKTLCPGDFSLRKHLSPYTMYLCKSRRRAAERPSFDFIPDLDT